MAQLTFIHSTMKSGKSLDLLKTDHAYRERGYKTLLFTSEVDTRYLDDDGLRDPRKGQITTRIGLKAEAWLIEKVDICRLAREENPDCILVDEAQFLAEEMILNLAELVDHEGIPVICYGLKNDFKGELFPGSKALLIYADTLREIETVCEYCTNKASMNLRLIDGTPVFSGAQILMGDNEYKPVCRKCYQSMKRQQAVKSMQSNGD
ncbi:thymidine kinase [Anoxynatronum buryatiense]|uniref:Thymidine kinase n=1 Tax=Anoxynatronum buryatiense TaxID=489973 RepID=A0AA46AHL3_9CLOT|nr:thymidine kinase [Anoxynatronum buryatiense]SMP40604.1 thymidine kinase [Anoxynatronum buryatiense]